MLLCFQEIVVPYTYALLSFPHSFLAVNHHNTVKLGFKELFGQQKKVP